MVFLWFSYGLPEGTSHDFLEMSQSLHPRSLDSTRSNRSNLGLPAAQLPKRRRTDSCNAMEFLYL